MFAWICFQFWSRCLFRVGLTNFLIVSCTKCGAGSYVKDNACLQCPLNTYSVLAGSTSCTPCKQGYTSFPGSTKCQCPAGFIDNGSTCIRCPYGQIPSSATSCTSCPSGMISNDQGNCISCQMGMIVVSNSCVCSPGYGVPPMDPNADVAAAVCSPCPAGSYSPGNTGVCSLCSAGQYSKEGASSCISCLPGYTSLQGSNKCQCPQDSIDKGTNCEKCPSGKIPSSDLTTCISCPAGWYTDNVDNICKICPENTFNPTAGARSCQNCPNSSPKGSATCKINCPVSFNSLPQKVGSLMLLPFIGSPVIVAGSSQVIEAVPSVQDCAQLCDSDSTCDGINWVCQDNPKCILFSKSNGQRVPSNCPSCVGYAKKCPDGMFYDNQDGSCNFCPENTYWTNIGPGKEACKSCGDGYVSKVGSISPFACYLCPADFVGAPLFSLSKKIFKLPNHAFPIGITVNVGESTFYDCLDACENNPLCNGIKWTCSSVTERFLTNS